MWGSFNDIFQPVRDLGISSTLTDLDHDLGGNKDKSRCLTIGAITYHFFVSSPEGRKESSSDHVHAFESFEHCRNSRRYSSLASTQRSFCSAARVHDMAKYDQIIQNSICFVCQSAQG